MTRERRTRKISRSNGSDIDKAKDAALSLLSYRNRSVFELSDRLKKKGFAEEVTAGVIERLKELNLLDDEDFARRLTKELAGNRGYGRIYIAGKLKERGIDPETAASVMGNVYSDIDERETAARLARKKQKVSIEDPAERGRIGRYLRSKGYTWDIIQDTLRYIRDRERDKE